MGRATLATDYLEQSADRLPEKTAVVDAKRSITYAALREEGHKVAQGLMARGIFGAYVGIYLDKSIECIAAFHGVSYAGNCYVILDAEMPTKRLQHIFRDVPFAAVITDEANFPDLERLEGHGELLLYGNLQEEVPEEEKLRRQNREVIDTDPLMVLFTSGSTGRPKGVVLPHRSAVDNGEWFGEKFGFDESRIFGNQAPLFFALSVPELYASLRCGGTIYLLDPKDFLFPAKLLAFLTEHRLNTLIWVPSLLQYIARVGVLDELEELPPLRDVFFCGSPMPNKYLNMWRKHFPDARFTNIYGMSELISFCAAYTVDRDFADEEPLPLGRATPNKSLMVLDGEELVAPEQTGVIGELCVRGSCLGLGYFGDFEKTMAAFCQNPLRREYPERIFRTGDLVRYNELGEIVYASRKDSQIKHQGHRVELGEIETILGAVPGVAAGCCLYDGERSEIVYFYEGDAAPDRLRQEARESLPRYMEPARILKEEGLPMTQNGKIDRMALRERFAGSR